MILGSGSYGEVTLVDNKAVKKFSKLSHLIQEYIALKYLNDCEYIVKSKGVNFRNLELQMELYDCSLRDWITKRRENNTKDNMRILYGILRGLIELQDRQLVHGDLKPGNILIKKNPLKVVLGDCGFVSISKYAKVARTALMYRDPVIEHDYYHDMFSFGIIFLELIYNIKMIGQPSYHKLKELVTYKVDNPDHRRLLYSLFNEERERRPCARELLTKIFKEAPVLWRNLEVTNSHNRMKFSIHPEYASQIKYTMKEICGKYNINRSQKGYAALLSYLNDHQIKTEDYQIYTSVTLMILSAVFGKSGFREDHVISHCNEKYSLSYMYMVLNEMLLDNNFIRLILHP